ncbi:NADP-dependent alkenal double bond reductase P2 [Madurella mycetomatis]|uniref:Dehydrogenase FUB6 n=1 Tax=Madurella mycetomatis TaxID=100816 RepID=A0A175W8T4_9PEZI|nr:NADP-dependent alkenal double bond reductase P2 [Madurella mycetomatis]
MHSNKTLIFKKVPTGFPIPGEHLAVEDRPIDISSVPSGGVTLSILYASFDPYLRGKMRPSHIKSFTPAFELGSPIQNDTVARVLQSDTDAYKPGDLLIASLPLAEYAVLGKDDLGQIRSKVHNRHGLKDLGLFLGPLGMPGMTAWSSLYEIGQPKKGETIFISSAAGAVGQIVGQIAKREGLRVVGSVGSDEKLEFIVKELGFDGGFNYKKERTRDALKRLAPEGLDIYYDNVGAEQLADALDAMNDFGKIVACGMIANSNVPEEERYGVRNLYNIVRKRLTMRGFIVYDHGFWDKYEQDHQEKMQQWLAEGSIQAKLDVTEGIDNAAEGLVKLFWGGNFGKAVLKIKEE